MKQYLTALSYQWTDGIAGIIQPQYLGRLPFNLPSVVNMAYNGALGPMNSKWKMPHPTVAGTMWS